MAAFPADEWKAIALRHFGFLLDLGYRLDSVSAEAWVTEAAFLRDELAVIVRYEREYSAAEVFLVRVLDGQVAPYPVFATIERIHWLAAHELGSKRRPPGRRASVDEVLAHWADVLQTEFAGLLAGDVSVLDEAEARMRRRIGTDPPVVTIWLPAEASEEEEAAAVADFQAASPGVEVEVKRYRRRLWPRRRRR